MKAVVLFMLMLVPGLSLPALNYYLRNELGVTGIVYLQHPADQFDLNVLYQPEFNVSHAFAPDLSLSAQAMGNALVRQVFRPGDDYFTQRGKIYRLWLAAATSQSEARVGLQRINFGSAQLLRPLQWFDNLDPRDKLEQTEGATALLLRHCFLNNTNVWLWGVRGRDKPRGMLPATTPEHAQEWGGRLQMPLPKGEIALSFNHRTDTRFQSVSAGRENRLGLDAHWDAFVGLRLEAFLSRYEHPGPLARYTAPVTLGADYTFSFGNGLRAALETLLDNSAPARLSQLTTKEITCACALDYPLGLLDNLLYFGTFKTDSSAFVQTAVWRRQYDRLGWDLVWFWDAGTLHKTYDSRGIKLILTYVF